MTATRWWVRLFARWQARIDAIKGQVRSLSLAVTAFSTFSLVLQNVGLGAFVPVVGALLAIVVPAYAYYYFEGGVWNQVARDRADQSSNFAAPSQWIGNEFTVRGLAAWEKGEPLTEAERELIHQELEAVFQEHRDGVDVEEPRTDRNR